MLLKNEKVRPKGVVERGSSNLRVPLTLPPTKGGDIRNDTPPLFNVKGGYEGALKLGLFR
jgi:hypothetical protein